MKKRWLIGFTFFISIATNVTLVSMLLGKLVNQNSQPMKVTISQLDNLPAASRDKALQIVNAQHSQLRKKIEVFRDTRKEVFEYIASEEYARVEAEKKLADLRNITAALQEEAQMMTLDIADILSPDERKIVLKEKIE